MTTSRDDDLAPEHVEAQVNAILDRVLRAHHRDEGHGGANWFGERILDGELVPIAREAFLAADDMPPDHEVLQVLDGEGMLLLGEGYHIITLVEPANRFVVKYAKSREGIPPLAPPREQPRREQWAYDHGILPDGSLHPTIWQHIRSLEMYGLLAVPNRVYVAESAYRLLNVSFSESASPPRLFRVDAFYRPTRIRMPASNARTAISGAGSTSAIMPASP